MTDQNDARVEVIQSDREGAAAIYTRFRDHDMAGWCRAGKADDNSIVMLFARHRIASAATARGEAVEECARIADKWAAENKAACSKARKSASQGSRDMAEMLNGAAIECNAIAQEIRSLPTPPARDEGAL